MASSGEAQESNLPPCLRNKSLYLGFGCNHTFVTIKIQDQLQLMEKKEPAIIKNAAILGEWVGIHEDDGLPIAMRIFVKDSKVYAIGGSNHARDKPCSHSLVDCLNQSSPSTLVYEFSNGTRPSFSPCSSLPVGMSFPSIVNHMGEIYVLYGQHSYDTSWLAECKKSVSENCFLVLRKDAMGWESLPCPPALHDISFCYSVSFYAAFGNMLYVWAAGLKMFGYHVKKKLWVETIRHPWIVRGSITLSSLSTETVLGKSSYVVISTLYDDERVGHKIRAALVDEDGKVAQTQVIYEAEGPYDRLGTVKLIELESNKDNSTFALVSNAGGNLIGLTVVRVSLCSPLEEHATKRPELHGEDGFLRAEVLVNQRYSTETKSKYCFSGEAFFY